MRFGGMPRVDLFLIPKARRRTEGMAGSVLNGCHTEGLLWVASPRDLTAMGEKHSGHVRGMGGSLRGCARRCIMGGSHPLPKSFMAPVSSKAFQGSIASPTRDGQSAGAIVTNRKFCRMGYFGALCGSFKSIVQIEWPLAKKTQTNGYKQHGTRIW